MDDDLAALLAAGERAAFHGAPSRGVEPLRRAVELAGAADRGVEASAAAWLLGVCLGAAGRYGDALGVLRLLTDDAAGVDASGAPGAEHRSTDELVFASLARSTSASLHRQLGRHAQARVLDSAALAIAEAAGSEGEALFDALLGLAADAVGLEEPSEAREQLARARAVALARPDGWRQRVRVHWVAAEVALLTGVPADAVAESSAALTLAEASGAPRHVAKSSLFLGVSLAQAGRVDEARSTLHRAGLLAESLGALPLLWPSRAVLGALLEESDPAGSHEALGSARATIRTIAAGLDEEMREAWLRRPDVMAVLAE